MQSPPNKQTTSSTGKSLLTVVLLLAWFIGLGLAYTYRQDITDWWRLRGYQPPAAVANLASQTSMTDFGRKIFYVNHPVISDKRSFLEECPNADREHSIVLGCYHGNQSGIYLLDVTDPRLEGVEQVTAAHEMLHGAYDRLSGEERKTVNGQLEAYYKNELKDERILKTIEAYKQSEPNDVVNEMHSIFASEIANLPDALEQYYSQYFDDRQQVVALASQYQAEFTSRQAAIAAYDAQLDRLKAQIDSLESSLKTNEASIESQREELERRRSNGDVAGYNAGVPGYNNLIANYNAQAEQLRSLIAQHNNIVSLRNELAQEADALVKNLSSEIEPINN